MAEDEIRVEAVISEYRAQNGRVSVVAELRSADHNRRRYAWLVKAYSHDDSALHVNHTEWVVDNRREGDSVVRNRMGDIAGELGDIERSMRTDQRRVDAVLAAGARPGYWKHQEEEK